MYINKFMFLYFYMKNSLLSKEYCTKLAIIAESISVNFVLLFSRTSNSLSRFCQIAVGSARICRYGSG